MSRLPFAARIVFATAPIALWMSETILWGLALIWAVSSIVLLAIDRPACHANLRETS